MKKFNLIWIIGLFLIPISVNAYVNGVDVTFEAFVNGVDSSANFTLTNPNVFSDEAGIWVNAPSGGGRAQPHQRLVNMTGDTNYSFRVSLNTSSMANDAQGMMFLNNNLSQDAGNGLLYYGVTGDKPNIASIVTGLGVCPGWNTPGLGYGKEFWNLTINLKNNDSVTTAWEIFINETQQCVIYPGFAFSYVSFGDQTTGGGRAIVSGYKNIIVRNLSYTAPPPDTSPPTINISINNTNPLRNDVINVTARVTDTVGLTSCFLQNNVTQQITTTVKTLTGTTDQCSFAFRLPYTLTTYNLTLNVTNSKTPASYSTNSTSVSVNPPSYSCPVGNANSWAWTPITISSMIKNGSATDWKWKTYAI